MQFIDKDTQQPPFSLIGKILWKHPESGLIYNGTGFYVKEKIVLTAAHNVYVHYEDLEADPNSLQFIPGKNGT